MAILTTSHEEQLAFIRTASHLGREDMSSSEAEELLKSKNPASRAYAASLPQLPDDLAAQALEDTSSLVRAGALLHPSTPISAIQEGLSPDAPAIIQISAAASLKATPELLSEVAATSKDSRVLSSVALNPNSPPDLLEEMLHDDKVPKTVLRNPNLPEETVRRVWEETQPSAAEVQTEVALQDDEEVSLARGGKENRKADEAPFDYEKAFSNEQKRTAIMANPGCPEDLLVQGLGDISDDVKYVAAKNSQTPSEALIPLLSNPGEDNFYVRNPVVEGALEKPNLSEDAMRAVIDHQPDRYVQLLLRREDVPAEVLEHAFETHPDLHYDILQNPQAPASLLEQGFLEDSYKFGKPIARSPQATPDLLSRIYEANSIDENGPAEGTNPKIAVQIRAAAIKNPNASEELISLALADESPDVRRVAAASPKASAEQLAEAVEDTDPKVRNAAQIAVTKRGLTEEVGEIRAAKSKDTEHLFAGSHLSAAKEPEQGLAV